MLKRINNIVKTCRRSLSKKLDGQSLGLPKHHKYSGQGVIEITAMLIVFTILISIVMSFSAFLYLQHAMITAAREGTRIAALNGDLGDADSQDAGTTTVQNYVINSASSLSGQTLTADDITVTAPDPDGTTGERTVTVTINYDMENPVNIGGFLTALGADGSVFDTFPVVATATMRYEE